MSVMLASQAFAFVPNNPENGDYLIRWWDALDGLDQPHYFPGSTDTVSRVFVHDANQTAVGYTGGNPDGAYIGDGLELVGGQWEPEHVIPIFQLKKTYNNTPSRSIITTVNASNGFQLSSTRSAFASYSITIPVSVTSLLAGAANAYVVFEICATNSSTGSNWQEIGRWTNGQTFTSLLTFTSVQPVGSDVGKFIPLGWYIRLRAVNVNGSTTPVINSGQEVVF